MEKKKKMSLSTQIFIALLTGAILGVVVHYFMPDGYLKDTVIINGILYVVGQGFIRLMQMLVVPLVFCSLVCGRYPWILNGNSTSFTIPKKLIGTCPSMSGTHIGTILHIDLSVTVNVIVECTNIPAVMWSCIGMRISYFHPYKSIGSYSLTTSNTIMPSFSSFTIYHQT